MTDITSGDLAYDATQSLEARVSELERMLSNTIVRLTRLEADEDGKGQPDDADYGLWNFKVPRGPVTIYPSKETPMTRLEHLALFHHFNDERAVFADLNRIVEAHNALVDVVNTMNDIVEITGTLEDTLDTTIELSSAGIHALHWIRRTDNAILLTGIVACDCGWHSDDTHVGAALDAYRKHLPEESETPE